MHLVPFPQLLTPDFVVAKGGEFCASRAQPLKVSPQVSLCVNPCGFPLCTATPHFAHGVDCVALPLGEKEKDQWHQIKMYIYIYI